MYFPSPGIEQVRHQRGVVRERAQVDVQAVRELLRPVRDDVRLGARHERLDLLADLRRRRADRRRRRSTASAATAPQRDEVARRARRPTAPRPRPAARCSPLAARRARPRRRARSTPSTSNASDSGASTGAPVSPSASRIRGRSVRNSSWLNSTRTRSTSNGAELEVLRVDADIDLAVEHRHLAVLEHALLRVAEVLALLRAAARRGARRCPRACRRS